MIDPTRRRTQLYLALLASVFLLPSSALAMTPFDISSTTARDVDIWIDNNVTDPSSVGNDLAFSFTGAWTSDGTTGTITVDALDVVAAFATSGLPGVPALVGGWSDLVITITVATGAVTSMAQTGTVEISTVNQPFSYDLNTTLIDTTTAGAYTSTGFANITFGTESFPAWCTNVNAGNIPGLACPPFDGPIPFGYNAGTGRFNAIGATSLNSFLFAYSTFGDVQLFEDTPTVPLMPSSFSALLSLGLAGFGALRLHRRGHGR